MTGTSQEASTTTVNIQGKLRDWASTKAEYKSVDKISVSLKDGQLEAAPLSDIYVEFNAQPLGCKTSIRSQEQGGAKYFTIATKVYRGTITVKIGVKQGTSAEARADILTKMASDLSVSGGTGSESTGEFTVAGGVWILESEPYNVPAPGQAQ
jgi:hypothetical protein